MLTWQTADRNVRNGWLFVFFAVALSVQVALVVIRLPRGAEVSGTVATAASAVFPAIGLGIIWVVRRRSKRYLERNGQLPDRGVGNDTLGFRDGRIVGAPRRVAMASR